MSRWPLGLEGHERATNPKQGQSASPCIAPNVAFMPMAALSNEWDKVVGAAGTG